ncbi:unnamed protein product, partial [Notodromas monacha]
MRPSDNFFVITWTTLLSTVIVRAAASQLSVPSTDEASVVVADSGEVPSGDYYLDDDVLNISELEIGDGHSEFVECPWTRTGKCLCGLSSANVWEFSCPLELPADPMMTNSTAFNGNYPGENASTYYSIHSYPVTLQFRPDSFVLVKCALDASPSDFKYLGDHDFKNVDRVEFYSCPPPNGSYSALVTSMGISLEAVESFIVAESASNFGAALSSSMLSGMSNLTYVSFRACGLTSVPEDIFASFVNLSVVDLAENRLTSLPGSLFRNNVNLTVVDLRNNLIEELPEEVFGSSPNMSSLYLNGNRFRSISEDSFKVQIISDFYHQGMSDLKLLELRNNHLGPRINASMLNSLSSLQWLSLANNSLNALTSDLFNSTKHMERLVISRNPGLKSVPEDLLGNLANLTYLNMEENGLESVPGKFLQNNSKLVNVTFAVQNLTTIPGDFFSACSVLERLDLSANKISHLPDNAFIGLTSLLKLDLSNNLLDVINDSVFAPLEKLTELSIANNRVTSIGLNALRSSIGLISIDASHNFLTFPRLLASGFARATPFGDRLELRTLDLSYNQVSELHNEWMTVLTRLQTLSLRGNNLSVVAYDDLLSVSQSIQVDLRDNAIHTVEFYDTGVLSLLDGDRNDGVSQAAQVEVFLAGNPFACDCRLYQFVKFLNATDKRRVAVDANNGGVMKCYSPDSLVNTTVAKVPLEALICNMSRSDCPPGCNCVIQPHGNNVSYCKRTKCLNLQVYHSGDLYVVVDCHDKTQPIPHEFPKGTTILRLENSTLSSILTVFANKTNNATRTMSSLKELHASDTQLAILEMPEEFPASLRLLDISRNNLTRFPAAKMSALVKAVPELKLKLAGNPWTCDCATKPYFDFLLDKFSRIEDFEDVKCGGGAAGRRLSELLPEDLCPEAWIRTAWVTSTLAVMCVMLLIITAAYIRYGFYLRAWLYARTWGLPLIALHDKLTKRIEDEEGCCFDVFISYSSKDEAFVVEELSQGLEHGNPPYKLNLHFRDWKPGEFIQDQVYTAVSQSRRTLVVLSENYVNSVWGRAEFRVAHTRALQDRVDRVIVVLFGDMPPKEAMDESLRTYVNLKTYLKWGDSLFWERLRYALSRPLASSKRPTTNGDVNGSMLFEWKQIFGSVADDADFEQPTAVIQNRNKSLKTNEPQQHLKTHELSRNVNECEDVTRNLLVTDCCSKKRIRVDKKWLKLGHCEGLRATIVIAEILDYVEESTAFPDEELPEKVGDLIPKSINELRAYMRYFNEGYQKLFNERANAEWNFHTNTSRANGAKRVAVNVKFSDWEKQEWRWNISRFDWSILNNVDEPELKRMHELLAVLGNAALNRKKTRQRNRLVTDMTSIYSSAKICPANNRDCNLTADSSGSWTLESTLKTVFKDYQSREKAENMAYAWKAWRDATGKHVREKFVEYVQLSNEAAVANKDPKIRNQKDLWILAYETEDFEEKIQQLLEELMPFYKELHAFVRHRLRLHYGEDFLEPDGLIPSHLLGNLWAQKWQEIFPIVSEFPNASLDVTEAMRKQNYTVKQMFELADRFFESLGLISLEEGAPAFYNLSMLQKPKEKNLNVVCNGNARDFMATDELP